jgi:hypothetical protein
LSRVAAGICTRSDCSVTITMHRVSNRLACAVCRGGARAVAVPLGGGAKEEQHG